MKATHPKIAALAALSAVAVSLSACGDDVTKVTKIEENHDARVVASVSEVRCNGTTGEMVFSQEDNQLYVCAGSQWISMKGRDGADGQDGQDGQDWSGNSSGAGSSSASGSSGNCTTRHISRVGVDGVEIACGNSIDTLWASNVQMCGDSVYDVSKRFCDHRDNRIYRWTKIGSQTWMAQNLNFCKKSLNAGYNQGQPTNDSAECYKISETYGALYQWHTAMRFPQSYDGTTVVSASQIQKPHRGICPEGWHIPDSTEWRTLYQTVGGYYSYYSSPAQKLKSAASGYWTGRAGVGTDDYGFNALPAGYRTTGGSLTGYGTGNSKATYWWSTAMDGNTAAWAGGLQSDTTSLSFYYGNDRQMGLSVRCIKD